MKPRSRPPRSLSPRRALGGRSSQARAGAARPSPPTENPARSQDTPYEEDTTLAGKLAGQGPDDDTALIAETLAAPAPPADDEAQPAAAAEPPAADAYAGAEADRRPDAADARGYGVPLAEHPRQ